MSFIHLVVLVKSHEPIRLLTWNDFKTIILLAILIDRYDNCGTNPACTVSLDQYRCSDHDMVSWWLVDGGREEGRKGGGLLRANQRRRVRV